MREPDGVRDYSIVAVAYKTVETFAGLTSRKLFLKNDDVPRTAGNVIVAPFKHPNMYQLVEYQLAHVLFKSDARARAYFVENYAAHVRLSIEKYAPGDPRAKNVPIEKIMDLFVGVLEAERVLSLWERVYEGSASILRRMRTDEALEAVGPARREMAAYFVTVANGVDPADSEYARFKPIFLKALERVRGRGFDATLLTSKWLLAKIVSELLKEKHPPASLDRQKGGGGAAPQNEAAPSPPGADKGTPQEDGTPQERTQALLDALAAMGSPEPNGPPHADFEESEFDSYEQKREAEKKARDALATSVKEDAKLEEALDGSTGEMNELVDKARNQTRRPPDKDEWLRRDAMAKVVIRDITKADVGVPVPLSDEDKESVDRMRTHFLRVQGRRRTALEDTGVEVDIASYIERKLTGVPLPVFRAEQSGRGFRSLLLLDRSQSMKGPRTAQAERAVRVINKALDFPFVTNETWGFQSLLRGQFDLTRYEQGIDSFDTDKSGVGGITPLHIAIRLGTRHLERSTDSRHMIVVTDGMPVWQTRDRHQFTRAQLMKYVRENVQYARSRGINVIGVMIRNASDPVNTKDMGFMFGSPAHWRLVQPQTFNRDLVKLIASGFLAYLRNA